MERTLLFTIGLMPLGLFAVDVPATVGAGLGVDLMELPRVAESRGSAKNRVMNVANNDTIAPIAVCQNITVCQDAVGVASFTAAQVDAGSWDNNAGFSLSVAPTEFNAVGTYPVTLTVTDAAGNTSTCISSVTVCDVNPPVALCQNLTAYLNASGYAAILPSDMDAGSTDNGTILSIDANVTTFDCSNLGPNDVTLIVTDAAGKYRSLYGGGNSGGHLSPHRH